MCKPPDFPRLVYSRKKPGRTAVEAPPAPFDFDPSKRGVPTPTQKQEELMWEWDAKVGMLVVELMRLGMSPSEAHEITDRKRARLLRKHGLEDWI